VKHPLSESYERARIVTAHAHALSLAHIRNDLPEDDLALRDAMLREVEQVASRYGLKIRDRRLRSAVLGLARAVEAVVEAGHEG